MCVTSICYAGERINCSTSKLPTCCHILDVESLWWKSHKFYWLLNDHSCCIQCYLMVSLKINSFLYESQLPASNKSITLGLYSIWISKNRSSLKDYFQMSSNKSYFLGCFGLSFRLRSLSWNQTRSLHFAPHQQTKEAQIILENNYNFVPFKCT